MIASSSGTCKSGQIIIKFNIRNISQLEKGKWLEKLNIEGVLDTLTDSMC